MSLTLIRGTQLRPGTVPWSAMAAGAIVPTASLIDGPLFVKSDGSVPMAAALNMGGFGLNNLAVPVNGSDAVTKTYVDSLANGLTFKNSARVIAISDVALTGLQTIDEVTLAAGDRVLLIGQNNAAQNGLWVAAAGAWARSADYASGSTQNEGTYVIVDEGTSGASTKYICMPVATNEQIIVDTTATMWTQDTSGNQITAGNGLYKSGNQILANITGNSGITLNSADEIIVKADPGGLLGVSASGVALSGGSDGQIMVTNSSNKPTWVTASGDATVADTGAITVDNTSGSGFVKYGDIVENETPAGVIDGTNTSFTLANPNAYGLQLQLNGQTLEPGVGNDYTISGKDITTLFAPVTGDKLRAYYFK